MVGDLSDGADFASACQALQRDRLVLLSLDSTFAVEPEWLSSFGEKSLQSAARSRIVAALPTKDKHVTLQQAPGGTHRRFRALPTCSGRRFGGCL